MALKLPELQIGETIYSRYGREMKVIQLYVNGLIGVISKDKEKMTAMWPREWCIGKNEQIPLF